MTDWLSQVATRTGPRYLAIADAIDDAIRRGLLGSGDKLLTQRALARRLGLTVGTVTRAYAEAERRGLIAGQVGRGTFVADRNAARAPTESVLWDDGAGEAAEGPIDLDRDTSVVGFSDAEFTASLQGYADSDAFRALLARWRDEPSTAERSAFAAWHADVEPPSDATTILPTDGGGGVLAALLRALMPEGGPVLVEALTARPVRAAVATLGLQPSPVQLDDDGPIPESLELACWSSGARVLVCTPSLHDPTVATMPEARRKAVADVAERFELTVVELEGQARYLDRPPPAIARFAPARTVYVASLSMILAPWLAAGYVAVPEALAGVIENGLRAGGAAATVLDRGLAAHWIKERFAHSLLSLQRTEARWRGRLARAALSGLPLTARAGGLRVWVQSQRSALDDVAPLADRARDRGVLITPAAAFDTRRGSPPDAVRLSLGACGSPARLRRALDDLAAVIGGR